MLVIKDLWVHYNRVEVLKNISLDVDESTIVAILGANGAGKTTMLRTISGLKASSSGEIRFRGQRINGLMPQRIVELGISQIMEGRHVFPKMSVKENLLMGAFLRKDNDGIKPDLERMFSHFPIIERRLNQRGQSLSGGEQQMLATARALMSRPKVLLMDEPTLGLAPLMVSEIRRIVQAINSEGVAVLLVEQNLEMALNLCHRGYVLETGSVVLEGSRRQLLEKDDYIRRAYLGAGSGNRVRNIVG